MPEAPPLDSRTEALVDLSAAIASRRLEDLDRTLHFASIWARPGEVEEVILQAHLFVGYPIALEAMARWRSVTPEIPDADPIATASGPVMGAQVCGAVYGGNYDKLRANVRALHPAMDTWMVEMGYGTVLSRPGLDLPTRELCIVATLAVLGTQRQLHSHLRGALNVGADPGEIEQALIVAKRHLRPAAFGPIDELVSKVVSPAG